VVTGGASAFDPTLAYAVKQTELWTPSTGPNGSWSTLAPSPTARMYHSTALLLPDGRVLSAGGEYKISPGNYGHNLNADFYSPPYLFKSDNNPIGDADRPAITGNIPLSIVYGEGLSFTRSTGSGTAISSVALIRPGAVTHSNNMDQRYGH